MDKPSLLKPTLIGGAAFGVIGSIPCVNLLNVLCCSLIMGGGFVAAYLYANDCKKLGNPFGAADGLKLGLGAGFFYWLVSSIISGIFQILMPTDIDEMIDQFEAAGMPPEALDQIEAAAEIMAGAAGVLLVLGVTFIFAMVFSVIGGLIGGMVFKYEGAPPAPPAPPADTAPPPPSDPE
jgi:hypothetical protein